jgi:peptidoglycan/LPS O-acetylase OafA/YrhL
MINNLHKHRHDIDGLRGISVLSVYFYHINLLVLNQNIFKGGFIGVDIFFVISGYIITHITLRNIKNNSFSITKFYLRRIKRILPITFIVLFILVLYSSIFDTTSRFNLNFDLVKSSFYFFTNYELYYKEIAYNQINSELIPLLHFWSLAIEEQFYFIFPLIFILKKKIRNLLIIIVFFISLLMFIDVAYNNFSKSFYYTHLRIWEIIFGVGIAIVNNDYKIKFKYYYNYIKYILLFLIFLFILFGDQKDFYPLNIIFIVFITGILLFKFEKEKKNYILNSSFLNFYGKISFSLYLLHFPIFSFLRQHDLINKGEALNSLKVSLILLLIISVISFLSYRFIEQPFRKKITTKFTLIFLLFLTFVTFNVDTLTKKYQSNSRLVQSEQTYIKQGNLKCHNRINFFCEYSHEKNKKLILIGSSKASEFEDIIRNDNKLNYNKVFSTHKGCDMLLPNFTIGVYDKVRNIFKATCKDELQINRLNSIKQKNGVVIFFTDVLLETYRGKNFVNFLNYSADSIGLPTKIIDNKDCLEPTTKKNEFNVKDFCQNFLDKKNQSKIIEDAIIQTIKTISNYKKVIIITPIPSHGWNVSEVYSLNKYIDFLKKKIKSNHNSVYVEEISNMIKNKNLYVPINDYYKYLDQFNLILNKLDKIADKIDVSNILCSDDKCYSVKNNIIYYIDDDHLSKKGANLVYLQIRKKLLSDY